MTTLSVSSESVSNEPASLNISLRRASDFSASLTFDVSAAGVTATSNIMSVVTGETVDAFTTTVLDAAAGQITISMTPDASAAMNVGTYRWEHVWDYPGSSKKTMLAGIVEVSE